MRKKMRVPPWEFAVMKGNHLFQKIPANERQEPFILIDHFTLIRKR